MKNTLSETSLDDVTHATVHALKQKGITLGDDGACELNDIIANFLTEQQAISITADEDAEPNTEKNVDLSFSVSISYEHIEGEDVNIPKMQRIFKEAIDEARQNGAFTDDFTSATDLLIIASESK